MVGPSVRNEVMRAQLLLVVYGEPVGCADSDDFDALMSAKMSYANEKAQKLLRETTKPCFDRLHRLCEELSKGDLAEMRESLSKSTQAYDRLVGLEKSRTKIQKDERAAFEAIEQKIEDCLCAVDEAKQTLRHSTSRVKRCLAEMREYLSAYGELLRHLEDHGKEQHYQQLLTKLEKECDNCRSHPVYELDVEQKRADLLGHLRDKRWREEKQYQPTRADMLEALYMGW